MHILISPSKIWAKKCTLYTAKYGIFLALAPWAGGLGVGPGPYSQDIPPEFLATTHGCGASPFHICAPPTSLHGCGFFNSVVVRLPFNSIFDDSK